MSILWQSRDIPLWTSGLGFMLLWESNAAINLTGSRAQAGMQVMGSGCRYRWSFTRWSATHLPLCSPVPSTGPWPRDWRPLTQRPRRGCHIQMHWCNPVKCKTAQKTARMPMGALLGLTAALAKYFEQQNPGVNAICLTCTIGYGTWGHSGCVFSNVG